MSELPERPLHLLELLRTLGEHAGDLIAMKRASGRPADLEDLDVLTSLV